MTESEKIDVMFSLMSQVPWIAVERFRDGVKGLLNECSNLDEFEAVDHILSNLTYCTSRDLGDAAAKAAAIIVNNWKLTPECTFVVGLAEANKTCGSTAYLRAIETCLPRNWGGSLNTNFSSVFGKKDNISNILIVDDFVGTGNKISAKLDELSAHARTKSATVYVTAFAGMTFGFEAIAKKIPDRIFGHIYLKKLISDELAPEKAAKLTAQMELLEKKIYKKVNDYSFGYLRSEAGFFLEAANIPNNNFPILWREKYADNTDRRTLFARR